MKKIWVLLFTGVFIISFCSCAKTEELPEIHEQAISRVEETVEGLVQVKDVEIVVEKDKKKIIFSIITDALVNEKYAKKILGEGAVRQLASIVAKENDDLEGPTKDSLGELYDYYDLMVSISSNSEQIEYQGEKVTNTPEISW